jgi:hypothetical protein
MDDQEEPTEEMQDYSLRCEEALSAMVQELISRSPLADREETLAAVCGGLLGCTTAHILACEGFEEEHFEPAAKELIDAFEAKVDELYAKYQGIES